MCCSGGPVTFMAAMHSTGGPYSQSAMDGPGGGD